MPPTGRSNKFLSRIRAGELTLMMAVRGARTTEVVRIAQATGHHAIMVDLEHSAMPLDVAGQIAATAGDLGLMPLVRIPERDYGSIGRLLDSGACGIVAPRVESVAEAESLSRACRFPPHGQRSQLAITPQSGTRPRPAKELNPLLDEGVVVQILLETPAGIANAAAIAALPGVDMIAIGANDLTAELGVPGDYTDPRFTAAVVTAAEACRAHGKPLMVGGIGDLEIVRALMPLGVAPVFLTGVDTDMLFSAADQRSRRFAEWHADLKR